MYGRWAGTASAAEAEVVTATSKQQTKPLLLPRSAFDRCSRAMTSVPTPCYMPTENMMCAFGGPGNISHGDFSDGVLVRPVVAVVAKGI